MSEKSQTQIDTERADSMLKDNRDDSFYKFPSKLREPWSSSQSEAYAPMSYMEFDADKATGGAAGLAGIEIIWADQTITYVRATDLLDGYDPDTNAYWSLVLTIGTGVFDKTLTYDATSDIFEDDGATPPVQTKYRFRLITQGIDSEGDPVNAAISMYGQYREVTTCINGEPFQRLTKVT